MIQSGHKLAYIIWARDELLYDMLNYVLIGSLVLRQSNTYYPYGIWKYTPHQVNLEKIKQVKLEQTKRKLRMFNTYDINIDKPKFYNTMPNLRTNCQQAGLQKGYQSAGDKWLIHGIKLPTQAAESQCTKQFLPIIIAGNLSWYKESPQG